MDLNQRVREPSIGCGSKVEKRFANYGNYEDAPVTAPAANDPQEAHHLEERSSLLRSALEVLAPQERQVIETAFFSELTYLEVATKLNQPLGTVKTRIRSGLANSDRRSLEDYCSAYEFEIRSDTIESIWIWRSCTLLQALPSSEIPIFEAHVQSCEECRQEIETLRPIIICLYHGQPMCPGHPSRCGSA